MLALLLALAYVVDPSVSTLKYTVIHKLHKVDATSRQVEGKAIVKPDTFITQVRAQVASFRSGDGNRDEHMLEVMDIAQHPYVSVKGAGKNATGAVQLDGEVDFHGVKRPLKVTLTVTPVEGGLHVTGGFDVSLEAHKVDRPSLLFVKVDDACHVDVDLTLREQKP